MATTTTPAERVAAPEDRPLDWGREREMNALEALMWRAEADPRLRSTICALEMLDCAPDWERFLAAHEWGTRHGAALPPEGRRAGARHRQPDLGRSTPTSTCTTTCGACALPDGAAAGASCSRAPSRSR